MSYFLKINNKWTKVSHDEYHKPENNTTPGVFLSFNGNLDWSYLNLPAEVLEREGPSWVEEVKAAFPELSATAKPSPDA